MLEIPLQLPRVRIERQRGTGEQPLVTGLGATADPEPGFRLRHSPIGEVEHRIVTADNPRIASGPEEVGQFAPGVAAGLAFLGDGAETPDLLAITRVVSSDRAIRAIATAARHAGQHFAIDDNRAGRVAVAFLPV